MSLSKSTTMLKFSQVGKKQTIICTTPNEVRLSPSCLKYVVLLSLEEAPEEDIRKNSFACTPGLTLALTAPTGFYVTIYVE